MVAVAEAPKVERPFSKRYHLLEKLGEGGMGSVYRAFDRLLRQPVALKRVSTPTSQLEFTTQADNSTRDDSSTYAQTALAHEFQLLASLHHPNVINVLDYGFDPAQQPYFTMTLLEGAKPITAAGRDQPFEAKMQYLTAMLQALVYLHQRGIIHRDLKPDNALVTAAGVVQVLDFGIAVKREQIDPNEDVLAGTLMYLAPEVLQGEPVSEASDLYAVGVIAYELLTGQHPFAGRVSSLLLQDILSTPPTMDRPGLTPALIPLLNRLLSKYPEDRYGSAQEVVIELSEAIGLPLPKETAEIRESFLQAASFVGREKEFSLLTGGLADAATGTGSAWLIGGESGVGKSRLMEELRVRALVNGMLVLQGQGVAEGGLAYQLWREPLRRLALSADLTDGEAGVIKPIVPDIAELLGHDIPDVPELEGRAGKQRLLNTITNLFRKCQEPTLLLLEDLQWAEESLDVLREINTTIGDLKLLIVGNYRDDERPTLPAELSTMRLIKLERLSSDAIEALTVSMLGEVGRQLDVVDLLQRETEGNAFFVVEVVRALAEEAGRLSNIGSMTLPKHVFAGGVQQVVQRRLNRVPDDAQTLLKFAAVVGRQLDLDVLRSVEPDRDLDQWLVACSNAAVLDVSEERFRFAHDKLREGLLQALSEEQKRDMHKQAAAALEQVYAASVDDYAGLICDHYEQAGEAALAATWAYRAGRKAQLSYVPTTAIAYYNRLINLWRQAESATPAQLRDQLMVHYGLGKMHTWLGHYADAAASYVAMRDLAERLGDGKAAIQAWLGSSLVLLYQGNLRGALANAEKVEQLAASPQTSAQEVADTRPEQAYALFLQGWSYLSLGELDKALTFGERALALNRALQKQDQMAQSMNLLGTVYLMLGEYAQAEPHLDQAFTLFKALGERGSAAALMNNLGLIAEKRGDYRLALERYQSALAQMREIKNRDAERIYLSNIGGAKVGLGLFAEAEMDLQEVVYMAGADGFGQLSETYRFLAEAYIGQDKLFLAEDTAVKALVLGRMVGSAEYIAAAWRALGQVASRVGGAVSVPDADTPEGEPETRRDTPAAECFAESLRLTVESGMKGDQAQTLRAWANHEIATGDVTRGRTMLDEAQALFMTLGVDTQQDARARL